MTVERLQYHIPILSHRDFGLFRSPGPGLGNLLFPISRALIASQRRNCVFVEPTLRQLKFGTFLRHEKDKRLYGDLFSPRSIKDGKNWLKSRTLRWTDESDEFRDAAPAVCYRGALNQFKDLRGNHTLIQGYLKARAKDPVETLTYDCAIHVRQGDFLPPELSANKQNVQIPEEWYRIAFEKAQDLLGKKRLTCMVFSDGDVGSLLDRLKIPSAIPEPKGNALTLLMCLSQARIIIGSRSTFSLWAQFLGQRVAIWPSNFDVNKYKSISLEHDFFL